MNIFVTRHAERFDWLDRDHWRRTSKFIGDPPISEKGKKQAGQLSDYLVSEGYHFDTILCSPYSRCLQTIQPFLEKTKMKVNIEFGLMENLYYENSERYEPRSMEYLRKNFGKFIDFSCQPEIPMSEIPKSEIIHEVRNRIQTLLRKIRSKKEYQNKSILLVTHACMVVGINEFFTNQKTEEKNTDIKAGVCSLSHYKERTGDRKMKGETSFERILNGENSYILEKHDGHHWDFSKYKGKWSRS